MSAVRHSIRTQQRAIVLRKAGWTYERIQQILTREGVNPVPSQNTIAVWTNPEIAERQRTNKLNVNRKARLEAATFRFSGKRTAGYRAAFVRELDKAGVPVDAIGKVCEIVFDDFSDDELWQAIDGVAA